MHTHTRTYPHTHTQMYTYIQNIDIYFKPHLCVHVKTLTYISNLLTTSVIEESITTHILTHTHIHKYVHTYRTLTYISNLNYISDRRMHNSTYHTYIRIHTYPSACNIMDSEAISKHVLNTHTCILMQTCPDTRIHTISSWTLRENQSMLQSKH